MQKQPGACAFSNARNLRGPRERLPGTNQEYCYPHYVQLELPSAGVSSSAEIRIAMPRSQSRSRWLTGARMAESF